MTPKLPRRSFLSFALAGALVTAAAAHAQQNVPHDNLNATLWLQKSVEFKASAMTAFALAKLRLEEGLKEPTWTAAPDDQAGGYQSLEKKAVIVDVDETVLDNSAYQAWNVLKDTTWSQNTWTSFVNDSTSTAIAGAVDFTNFAESKGVTVFYVTNRLAIEEPATRARLKELGFPVREGLDTILTAKEQTDWGSAKGTRRKYVAAKHRILLLIGDNLGDFVDDYKGTEEQREQVRLNNKDRWGKQWIVIGNPSYGSFESAPYGHVPSTTEDDKRKAKRAALMAWAGPPPSAAWKLLKSGDLNRYCRDLAAFDPHAPATPTLFWSYAGDVLTCLPSAAADTPPTDPAFAPLNALADYIKQNNSLAADGYRFYEVCAAREDVVESVRVRCLREVRTTAPTLKRAVDKAQFPKRLWELADPKAAR